MHFKMSSAICFNLDQSKILSSGNRLINATIQTEETYHIGCWETNCKVSSKTEVIYVLLNIHRRDNIS